jgi:hypothetical protein
MSRMGIPVHGMPDFGNDVGANLRLPGFKNAVEFRQVVRWIAGGKVIVAALS